LSTVSIGPSHNLIRVIPTDTTASEYGFLTYLVGGYQAELAEPI